jgi:hypothetical protein
MSWPQTQLAARSTWGLTGRPAGATCCVGFIAITWISLRTFRLDPFDLIRPRLSGVGQPYLS